MTTAILAQVATNMRALAGTSNTSVASLAGYWREIALACEELAGAATSANANLLGYMLRAATAMETLEGTDGTAENRNYRGLMKRCVDAMEEGNGAVGTGSLENRLLLASADWSGGSARIIFTGSIAEGATTGRAVGTATLANPPEDIGTLTWSELGTGTGAALFAINSSTGAVTNTAAVDYDVATGGATSYTYGIQVTDGVYTYELMATINVNNVFEAASLSALTGTFSLAEDAAANDVAGAISGKTSGSTLSLADDAGGRVAISGTNIVRGATALDYETATSHSFTIRETLADSANSPRDTVLSLTVTNVTVTLGTVALDSLSWTTAASTSGTITGKTSGSTLSLSGSLPAGLSVDLTALTWTWTHTAGSVSTGSFTIVETHPDATTKNHAQSWAITDQVPVIIVALLGQSNMIGRTLPTGSETSPSGIWQWVADPADPAYETLVEDITPLKFPEGRQDYDPTAGENLQYAYGPGSNLAIKIKEQNPSAIVVVVPCAYGASSLMSGSPPPWQGHATPGSGGVLFEAAVTATNAARAAAASAYPGAAISCITAWVQGDQESTTRSAYAAALTTVIESWRTRVTGVTHGKWIIGSVIPEHWTVGDVSYDTNTALVNAAQVDVSLNVSNVIYVPGPFSTGGDNLHYAPVSTNATFGNRLGDSLADTTGPSVTTATTQGGEIGTTQNILLEHDDALDHATFHFAGGADDALFEITDPYINGTTQPQVRLIDNTEVAGDYVFKVKARDGSGNYGADRTITFTQAVPSSVPVTVNEGSSIGIDGGFGTTSGASATFNIKAGQNLFFVATPAGAAAGSSLTATVNGNACELLGYVGGGTLGCLGYESVVDVTGATFEMHWSASTLDWRIHHVWTTGLVLTPASTGGHDWGSAGGSPHTGNSLTVPTDGIIITELCSANTFSTAVSGTTVVNDDDSIWFSVCTATRDTTGACSVNGGGSYGADLALAFEKIP